MFKIMWNASIDKSFWKENTGIWKEMLRKDNANWMV